MPPLEPLKISPKGSNLRELLADADEALFGQPIQNVRSELLDTFSNRIPAHVQGYIDSSSDPKVLDDLIAAATKRRSEIADKKGRMKALEDFMAVLGQRTIIAKDGVTQVAGVPQEVLDRMVEAVGIIPLGGVVMIDPDFDYEYFDVMTSDKKSTRLTVRRDKQGNVIDYELRR